MCVASVMSSSWQYRYFNDSTVPYFIDSFYNVYLLYRQYRLVAYRHILEWILAGEVLGSKNRVILPSCVVTFIRQAFPSEDGNYSGFKWPTPYTL